MGLQFPNRIGLAAGYDKNGIAWRGLSALGFGHLELGTVTPQPQFGNPKPRMFREPGSQGLVNRMGFPNAGAEALAKKLKNRPEQGPILGVNIGINKTTSLNYAPAEYAALVERFHSLADYLAINISSPNTAGLRDLQSPGNLQNLLATVMKTKASMDEKLNKRVPLVVKLSPDLVEGDLLEIAEILLAQRVDGLIISNTTSSRPANFPLNESGGLSGPPLQEKSTALVQHFSQITSGKIAIIAVGGIVSATDAKKKLDAGASLVQIYTGLVYRGPGLVKEIVTGLEN
jgi:dihydroorotate dehydrogenase